MFENESIVRIGRAKDNDIVIYNSVVSRHHLELWNKDSSWAVVNFGANGTYLHNKLVTQTSVADGMVLRLGRTGPRLLVKLGPVSNSLNLTQPNLDPTDIKPSDSLEEDEDVTRIEFLE